MPARPPVRSGSSTWFISTDTTGWVRFSCRARGRAVAHPPRRLSQAYRVFGGWGARWLSGRCVPVYDRRGVARLGWLLRHGEWRRPRVLLVDAAEDGGRVQTRDSFRADVF